MPLNKTEVHLESGSVNHKSYNGHGQFYLSTPTVENLSVCYYFSSLSVKIGNFPRTMQMTCCVLHLIWMLRFDCLQTLLSQNVSALLLWSMLALPNNMHWFWLR